MTVDFSFQRARAMQVVSVSWTGAWSESRIRREFERLAKWAEVRHLRTGQWIFMEPGERRWTAAIEVRGRAKGEGTVRVRKLPAARVAAVTFDPDAVSARVVYHGLNDWLRWRRRDKEIRSVGASREVYPGNPWKDPKAWARTQVQFLVR